MEVVEKPSKPASDMLDKKFDKIIRAIKEVGFPIVAFLLIFSVGIKWADRLLTSQEIFINKVTESVEVQTENGTDIRLAVQKILNSQEDAERFQKESLENEKRQTIALEGILGK